MLMMSLLTEISYLQWSSAKINLFLVKEILSKEDMLSFISSAQCHSLIDFQFKRRASNNSHSNFNNHIIKYESKMLFDLKRGKVRLKSWKHKTVSNCLKVPVPIAQNSNSSSNSHSKPKYTWNGLNYINIEDLHKIKESKIKRKLSKLSKQRKRK